MCLAGLITKSEHLAENAAYGLVTSTTQELFRAPLKKSTLSWIYEAI